MLLFVGCELFVLLLGANRWEVGNGRVPAIAGYGAACSGRFCGFFVCANRLQVTTGNKRNGFFHPAIAQSHPTQAHKRYSSNTLQPHKVTELTSTYSIPSLRDRKSPQKPCQSIFHKSSCQASFKKPRSPASPRSPSSINTQPEAPQGRPCGRRGRLCRRIWSRCCSGRTCRCRTSCAAPSSCRSASC